MLTNTGKKNPLITCCHSNSSSSAVILDVFCEMKHLQWNSTVCLWAKVLGPLMDRSGQPRITASSTRVNSKPVKSCGPRQASGTQPQPAPHPTGRLTELHRFNSVSTFSFTFFSQFVRDCDHLSTEHTDGVWSLPPTFVLLSVWFCLHSPDLRLIPKVFSHYRWI